MNNKKIIIGLGLITLLSSCGGSVTTTIQPTTSEVKTTSITETSSNSSVSSAPSVNVSNSSNDGGEKPADTIDLTDLQKGFATKSVYTKTYPSSSSSQFFETKVVDGVTDYIEYKSTVNEWADATSENIMEQDHYEIGTNDYAFVVTCDSAGNPIYTNLKLVKLVTGKDANVKWNKSGLANAFSSLTVDDFEKGDEDNVYNLIINDNKLYENPEFEDAVENLGKVLYPRIETYSVTKYVVSEMLTALSLTVDNTGKPVSFVATYEPSEGSEDGYTYVECPQNVSGTFTSLGENSTSKYTAPEAKYAELDKVFDDLKKQNYEFTLTKHDSGDSSYGIPEYDIVVASGKSDGLGNFEVTATENGSSYLEETFGYKQISETSYRRYNIVDGNATYEGEAVDGTVNSDILPQFQLSSALFNKQENTSIYDFVTPLLMNNDYIGDINYVKFAFTLTEANIRVYVVEGMNVELTDESVTFRTYGGKYSSVITFTKIGEVAEITTNPQEN